MSSVAFRLTIYQANGTTPDLTMTSIRSGTNPYIVGVPSGDGQEVDLLTGTVRSGAYNIEVADVVTGSDGTGTVRLVTNKLEDASFRQQLLSRRAKLEMSRNNGSTWSVWIFGYLTGLRQIDAITYGFTVSDSRRIESTHTAFTWSADTSAATDERREFPNRGCLIGGPTIQNFGPLRASGGWEYAWKEVQGGYLALAFVAAYNAPSYSRENTMNRIGFFNALRPFFQSLPPIANLTGANFEQIRERQYVFGFPAVMAIVTSGSSVWYGTVRAAHTPPAPGQNGQGQLALPSFGEMNYLYIELDPGQSTSYPSANATVRVQLLQKEVSSASPLYINEHPVDIVTKLYETVNVPFNASSATTVKGLVGDDVRLALRVTEPVNLGQFLAQSIFGPFGFSARTNASGEQEFFATRIANSATPTTSISDDDVVGDNPPPVFEVDEASVVTSFRLTAKSLAPFVPDPTGSLQAPPDGLVEVETSQVIQNGDTSTYSTREVGYRFPGMVHDGSIAGAAFTLSPEVVGRFFTGIVAEGFDRFGRGAIASEVQVLSTASAASLQVGDEVLIDVGYYPNKNYRIGESSVGSRIAQIVRRTEAPEGPIFKLIDSGVNAQPTSPTFTVASFAGDPRRVAAVTVTNAATLNSANVTLAVQYQVSASSPTKTGTLYTRFRPGTIPTVAFTLPAVAPGSKVWVRMRTERTEYRASAWTAWTDVTLDAWIPPASLTVGTKTANSVALSWSLGSPTANTIDPLDVFAYKGASAPADWTNYRVGSLANGSTSITVRDLDASTQYTFGVAFKDEGSGAYSSFATATTTTNAVNTVQAPNAPKMKVYTSFPDAGLTTGVALAIGAVEGYNIVVERAADSSGSPGAWKEIALLAPLTPIFVDPLPSDGATRWYRVFYRLSGFLDGTPGTARSATPIAIPDDLVGQNASIISGGATLTFGNYLVGTPDSFYDGATSQSVAVDATPNATNNKVVARDASGNFAANTITATLNGPAPAGQLTGDTLAANVVTSSLTTVGTIGTGTWQGTSVGKNYGGTGLTSSAFTGITNERVFAYDGASGAFFVAPSGSNGQALVYTAGALAWGNPAPGPHVLADTTGLGAEHTVSGLTSGMILQATGATTARFQTPSIPASSVTAGSFGGNSYTFTNDLTVSGTLTASLPYSSITGKPSYFPADLTSVNGTLGTANGGTANASWPAANSGEYVVIYDSVTGAERLEAGPQGSNGQALIVSGGALTWGNPAPGPHVLATTTGLGTDHTVSGLTSGMILQATGATTARFQTPSIPASSVTAGTFSGTSYTITNDLTVSGTLTASLPFSSITGTPTTLAGYGITDALSNSTSSTQSGYFGDIFLWDDTNPSHYLQITNSADLSAARTLSINVNDASRTVSLSGNLTVSGNADISGTSSGTNTGDQTITLTGAVTGSGTGSFATTYAGTVPINKGGTNATTYTVSGTGTRALVYSITNGAFEAVAAGSSGQFLQSAGTTGDITWATPPTFTSSAAGYAPASGGGTSNFLRADGTWAVPSVGSVSANNVTAGTFAGATYTFSNSVTFTSGVRVANGETYKIINSGGTAIDVLSATTLGAGVINSSLTSVGTLTSGALGAGFTAIDNARLANSSITINGSSVSLGGSITVDTSKWTSSGSNIYRSTGTVSIGTTPSASIELLIQGGGATASTYGLFVQNSAATATFWVADNGNVSIPNGTLGIGTSPGSNRLAVNGTTQTTAVVINGTSAIGTASLSIYAGGSGGVAWSSGVNIGDGTSYLNFIQDVGISRWRNFGTGGFQWFSSGGFARMNLNDAGDFEITERASINTSAWGTTLAKFLVGAYLSNGSSAIAQFNGFLRIRNQLFIHDDANVANSGSVLYDSTGLRLISSAEGAGSRPVRLEGAAVFIPQNTWVRTSDVNLLRDSYFGYSSGYRAVQVGLSGGSRAISLGVDLTGNASGNFVGKEIVIPNDAAIIAPNAANNNYVGVLRVDSSNNICIGGADYTTAGRIYVNNSTGNVGIGTTSPSVTLHVDASGGGIVRVSRLGAGAGIAQMEADGTDGTLTATNTWRLRAGGAERVTIASGGNVGIGTTAPNKRLQVTHDTGDWVVGIKNYGVAAYGLQIDLSGSTGSTGTFALATYTQTGTGFFVKNDGNVGIGLTSPYGKLSVTGAHASGRGIVDVRSSDAAFLCADTATTDGGLRLQVSGTDKWLVGIRGSDNLYFNGTSDTTLVAFMQSGAVGIGTTSFGTSATKLAVGAVISSGTSAIAQFNGFIRLRENVFIHSANADSAQIAYDTTGLKITTSAEGASGRIISLLGGNVGIGTTSPNGTLDVGKSVTTPSIKIGNSNYGNSYESVWGVQSGAQSIMIFGNNASNEIRAGNTGSGGYLDIITNNTAAFTSAHNGNLNARFASSGATYFGTTTSWASAKIAAEINSTSAPAAEFNGTGQTAGLAPVYIWNNAESGSTYFISFYSDGVNNPRTLRGYINYRRDNATLNLTTASDYRIKTIHGPYTKSGAIFDKLKVHEGTIHGETARVPMVLAHELQEAYEPAVEGEKDAVNEDGSPKLQMVSYVAMIPVMLAEIKSLRERVAQLETMS